VVLPDSDAPPEKINAAPLLTWIVLTTPLTTEFLNVAVTPALTVMGVLLDKVSKPLVRV